MQMKNTILNPKNWFLSATEKKRLDIKRRYYGENLERALVDLDFPIETHKIDNHLHNLDLDEQYGRIDQFTKFMKKSEIKYGADSDECKKEQLETKKQFNKISDNDYEKESATLRNEPWVTVIKLVTDPSKPTEGFFDLDWNSKFIEVLKENGYIGEKPELLVQNWFDTLCKGIAKEYGAVFPLDDAKDFDYKTQGRRVKNENGKIEIL